MVRLFTGFPGCSKSLHTCEEICKALKSGKNVIANMVFFDELVEDKKGCFIGVKNSELLETSISSRDKRRRISEHDKEYYSYILGLYNFAENFHVKDENGDFYESQTLLIIDESQFIFNPRRWNRNDRLLWVEFFTVHRHWGYDVILISQDEKNIDKQILRVVNLICEHRSVKEYRLLGKFLAFICGGNLFMHIYKYAGMSKKDAHIKSRFYTGEQYYKYYRHTQRY